LLQMVGKRAGGKRGSAKKTSRPESGEESSCGLGMVGVSEKKANQKKGSN